VPGQSAPPPRQRARPPSSALLFRTAGSALLLASPLSASPLQLRSPEVLLLSGCNSEGHCEGRALSSDGRPLVARSLTHPKHPQLLACAVDRLPPSTDIKGHFCVVLPPPLDPQELELAPSAADAHEAQRHRVSHHQVRHEYLVAVPGSVPGDFQLSLFSGPEGDYSLLSQCPGRPPREWTSLQLSKGGQRVLNVSLSPDEAHCNFRLRWASAASAAPTTRENGQKLQLDMTVHTGWNSVQLSLAARSSSKSPVQGIVEIRSNQGRVRSIQLRDGTGKLSLARLSASETFSATLVPALKEQGAATAPDRTIPAAPWLSAAWSAAPLPLLGLLILAIWQRRTRKSPPPDSEEVHFDGQPVSWSEHERPVQLVLVQSGLPLSSHPVLLSSLAAGREATTTTVTDAWGWLRCGPEATRVTPLGYASRVLRPGQGPQVLRVLTARQSVVARYLARFGRNAPPPLRGAASPTADDSSSQRPPGLQTAELAYGPGPKSNEIER